MAVKCFEEVEGTDRLRSVLNNEAYVMSLLHHPNVATFYGAPGRPDCFCGFCGERPEGVDPDLDPAGWLDWGVTLTML